MNESDLLAVWFRVADREAYKHSAVAMSITESIVPAPMPEQTWAVYRQDDNGNRFVVNTRLRREEAERLVAEFEARGHKQVYWAEPELT